MAHLDITTHTIVAHNGVVHGKPKAEQPKTNDQTAPPTQANIQQISPQKPSPSTQFLGEGLLLLIVVVPIVLFQLRRRRFS